MKAMILSLGGSPEPLVASMKAYQPEAVLFFASRESESKIEEVRASLEANQMVWPTRADVVCTPDAQELVTCYRVLAHEIPQWCTRLQIQEENLVVDYTGGTKAMTAALVLYSSFKFKHLLYVSGTERSKNNLGVVITGKEFLVNTASPLEATLVTRWDMWKEYTAATRYVLVAEEAEAYCGRIDDPATKRLLRFVKAIFGVLGQWDAFVPPAKYMKLLQEAMADMDIFLDANPQKDMAIWRRDIKTLFQHMASLQQESNAPGDAWIVDLLANAKRRAHCEYKYEDAVARLYSAFERLAQQRVQRIFGASTSKFPSVKVPENLRQEFDSRHADPENPGYLKFGLHASMQVLREDRDSVGLKYFEVGSPWIGTGSLLQARNNSVLGHGLTPVNRELYDRFWNAMVELWGFNTSSLPVVPPLPDLPSF